MFEPNVKSVVTNSTKPVEITLDSESKVHLKTEELIVPTSSSNNVNETSSYSAYASAESSPNQNSLLANAETTTQLRQMKQTSATSSNSSLSSYLTIDNSRLIDDFASAISGRETPTNKSNKNTTPTESFYEITTEQVNRNYLDDEFQSLPPSFMDEMKLIKTSEQINFNLIENDLVNVNLKSRESVSLIINKEIGLQLNDMDSSLNEKSNPATPTPTNTSPFQKSSIKTTAMAFLNLFKTDKPQEIKPEITKPTEMNKSKSANFSTSLQNDHNLSAKLATTAITSASSPNPDCSPYKLLLNELPSNKTVVINDFNSRTSKSQTEEQKDLAQQDKPSNNNLIESLACLNQKESDKIDPILSSASKNAPQSSVQQQEEKKKTESLSSQTETKPNNDTKVDHVPASSHEFCMNLNFNLAAAAAATAAGPVVVVDNLKTSPDHIRFTSNASTSSIHNDLKLILEESKEQTHKGILDSPPQSGNKKLNKSNQQQPKQQHRVPKTKLEKKTESSDADNLNLIKAMMLMVENNKQQKQQDKPVISWPKKENNRFRYSREFLNQINEQRSEFIDQIYPDIFKAYCYCMNGKYWDPEKYFDIVQFPGEFDKLATRGTSNNNNSRTNNYNSYPNNKQQNYQRKRNNSNSKYDYNNKSKSGDLLTPSTSVISHIESPQPLQVPKNSPKVTHQHDSHTQHGKNSLNLSANSQKLNKENKKKLTNLLSTLGIEQQVKTTQADKILLDLIKNNEQPPVKCNDLLEILNSKKEQFDRRPTNILENLFPGKTSPQQQVVPQLTPQAPKHFPQVLTAQELEMSQLLAQQKQNKHKLPINQSEINRFDDLNNTSDAYKQLVKNLSNHPLNSPLSTSNIMSKLQSEQKTKQSTNNNGTNVLRQLLNLNPEINKYQPEKKSKKKTHNHHHHHNHNKTKSPSTSMLTSEQIESMAFPSTIPNEKPFDTYLNEETKHVEKVVASSLNHVLYKTPQTTTTQTKNTIENLFQQLNSQQLKKKIIKSESDHFNSLINNMMPNVDKKTETSDILKWFINGNQTTNQTTTSFSPHALSEIEFMELHHPKVLNKLY